VEGLPTAALVAFVMEIAVLRKLTRRSKRRYKSKRRKNKIRDEVRHSAAPTREA
jgi:hypothetical protein